MINIDHSTHCNPSTGCLANVHIPPTLAAHLQPDYGLPSTTCRWVASSLPISEMPDIYPHLTNVNNPCQAQVWAAQCYMLWVPVHLQRSSLCPDARLKRIWVPVTCVCRVQSGETAASADSKIAIATDASSRSVARQRRDQTGASAVYAINCSAIEHCTANFVSLFSFFRSPFLSLSLSLSLSLPLSPSLCLPFLSPSLFWCLFSRQQRLR